MLDASAMIAYLWNETGADVVEDLLADDNELCTAHAINLCELYYKARRFADEDEVRSGIEDLIAQGIIVREDLDPAFWMDAGDLKVNMPSVPLADCFVAILATRFFDGVVVTADHPDFDPLAEQGICRVTFIR